ncbi:MAG: hypothetical protein ACE5K8_06850 [Candidatus Zixiibacteriota bacterium]
MSGTSPKQLEANRRNAQRSTKTGDACGPQTPCDGVAAIPVLSEVEGSDRGLQTSALKPFGGWDDIPVARSAVAHIRRSIPRQVLHLSGGFSFKNAIEHQLHRTMYSLQDYRRLSNSNLLETPPIDVN